MEILELFRILGELILIGFGVRERIGRTSAEKEAENQAGAARTGFALAAPASIRSVERDVSLLPSGEATWEETWNGITPDGAFPQLAIPFREVSTGTAPSLGKLTVSRIPGSPQDAELYREQIQEGDGWARRMSTVLFPGAVDPDTRGLGFHISVGKSQLFCATREEAEEAYADDMIQQEYASIVPRFPTDRMRMRITMPDEYEPLKLDARARVFYEDTEMPAEEERKRVKEDGGFNFSGGVATLAVTDPKPGLAYAISWTPPPDSMLGG